MNNAEIATEILKELLKARGYAIAGIDHIATQQELMKEYLSDEAVAKTYKEILNAVRRPYE